MSEKQKDIRIAGMILAGGNAHRMGGIAKGMLRVGGRLAIIERLVVHLVLAGMEEIVVSANDARPYSHLGCAIVPDRRTGLGPLAGIEAALAYFGGRYDAVLCMPCDLPALSRREMLALRAAFAECGGPVVFAETGDSMPHPLCAVIRTELQEHVCGALDEGATSVGDLWRRLGGSAVRFDDSRAFSNLNSPEDVDAWFGEHAHSQQLSGFADGNR